jgi:hypothetical protein
LPFHVTLLYAGINGLILLVLALNVVRLRRNTKVGLGDGGNEGMLRACRMHANAAEYVPIILILMGLLELQRESIYLLHALGIMLTLGRILHPIGIAGSSGESFGRAAGMLLTWVALLVAAVAAIVAGLAPTT